MKLLDDESKKPAWFSKIDNRPASSSGNNPQIEGASTINFSMHNHIKAGSFSLEVMPMLLSRLAFVEGELLKLSEDVEIQLKFK